MKINILRMLFATVTLFTALALHSQNAIPIPNTLSGSNIDLTIQAGSSTINVFKLPTGTYALRLSADGKTYSGSFVEQ